MGSSLRQRGFTLLEVLVVLVITSMLSLLLIDGVGQVMLIEQRMGTRLKEARTQQLQQAWLRQLISGARASRDYPFQMTASRITGMTLAPLAGEPGMPTAFELALVDLGDITELRYREGEGEYYTLWEVANAELVSPPRFSVLNSEGTYDSQWRSKEGGAQWPSGLALRVEAVDWGLFWHFAVQGRKTPRPTIEELMGT